MQKKKTARVPPKAKGGPGRLTAEEAARLPDRLLDAALELFNAQGYGGTSMEQIARRAGASTKTLYARFTDKPAVVQAVVNRIIEASLKAAGAATPDPGRDPRRFLIALGTEIVTNIGQAGAGLIQIALSEARHSPVIARMYNATLARGRAIFRGPLARPQGSGNGGDVVDQHADRHGPHPHRHGRIDEREGNRRLYSLCDRPVPERLRL